MPIFKWNIWSCSQVLNTKIWSHLYPIFKTSLTGEKDSLIHVVQKVDSLLGVQGVNHCALRRDTTNLFQDCTPLGNWWLPTDQAQCNIICTTSNTNVTKLIIFQSVLLMMVVSNFHTIIRIHRPWVFLPHWQCLQNILQGLLALGSPWLRKLSILLIPNTMVAQFI